MTTRVQIENSGGTIIEGSIVPGPTFVRSFAFDFSTAGVTTGVPILQLRAGDVVYDIGFAIPTAFNGTTPTADVGTFTGNTGLFDQLSGNGVDLTAADAAVTDNTGLSSATTATWLQAAIGAVGAAAGAVYLPGAVTAAADCELLLVVTQSGQKGGTATGATAGVGVVYVVTCTPG